MKERLKQAWHWTHRYLPIPTILGIGLLAYIVLCGENTVFNTVDYYHRIDSLEHELALQRDTMQYYRELNRRLPTDPELMERVVREQYGMKKANEDVYIFEN
mgnify:CR=1 FL=1